ncbi:unnamed protein product [Rotaria magnacalcarata]|uniref:Uncharacterized protein n=1 Tax=Rotaria magnacalcarata TaxID=392030 RepID=A0A816TBF1_9BILA|nr:unnamed protein product [Rotaria magnacalcarata]
MTGSGRLRQSKGKGQKLVISALLSNSGFHLTSVDIFKCDENHSMNSNHFVRWIDQTSSILRKQLGKDAKVLLVLDNVPWHNRLTEETMPPKRSCRKELISDWLMHRRVPLPTKATKAVLLQLAFANFPEKRYVVDEAAAASNVDILRLFFRSFDLNLGLRTVIPLVWAGLKSYVREHNTNFRLSDVRNLTQTWMASLDASTTTSYLDHAQNIENTFKKSDRFAEHIEEKIVDDDDEEENEMYSEEEEETEMDSEEEDENQIDSEEEEDENQIDSEEEEISE